METISDASSPSRCGWRARRLRCNKIRHREIYSGILIRNNGLCYLGPNFDLTENVHKCHFFPGCHIWFLTNSSPWYALGGQIETSRDMCPSRFHSSFDLLTICMVHGDPIFGPKYGFRGALVQHLIWENHELIRQQIVEKKNIMKMLRNRRVLPNN